MKEEPMPEYIVDTFDVDHPPTAPEPEGPAPTAEELAKVQAVFDRVTNSQK